MVVGYFWSHLDYFSVCIGRYSYLFLEAGDDGIIVITLAGNA